MFSAMLTLGQLIPPLTARAADGRTVRAWDFKQKRNLVIVFLHAGCWRCEEYLARLAARAREWSEHNAVVLAIFAEMPPAIVTDALPAPVLAAADVSGRAHRAFLGEASMGPSGPVRVGAFVTDRFGELCAQWAGKEAAELPPAEELLGWLSQIEVACEECGVSHWGEP